MPVCLISISEKVRKGIGVTLMFLNFTLAIIGLIVLIMGATIAVIFNQQKNMTKDFPYWRYTYFAIFSGLGLIVFHLLCAKVCLDFSNYQTRHNVQGFMVIYIGLLFVTLILLIALSISCLVAVSNLMQGFEKGFLDLMSSYDSNKDVKMQIDSMQINHQCCGSTGYKDWIETSWYSEEFIRPELRKSKSRGVPFTCCDPAHNGPCLHDSGGLPRPGFAKDEDRKSFYKRGCSKEITVTVQYLLSKLAPFLLLPMWMELGAMLLTKYLYTSALNAQKAGDGEGKGYGYLIEKCPFSAFSFCEVDLEEVITKNVKMAKKNVEKVKKNVKKFKKKDEDDEEENSDSGS